MTSIPLCWHAYTAAPHLSDETRQRRLQAVRNFPIAIFAAVWAAHSRGPDWRTRMAWAAVDAVDRGEKIVAPLACFLRIGRKAVKSSGRIQSNPVDWTEYGKTRRVLRIASAVPGIEWDVVRIWTFAAADVAARATGLDIGLLMFTPSGQVLNLAEVAESMSEQKRLALLRHSIRLLRRDAKQGLAAIRSGEVFRSWLAETTPPPRIDLELPCGWRAVSLVTDEDIRNEGRQMGNCVGDYAKNVTRGSAQIFALQSADGRERTTVLVNPPLGDPGCADSIRVRIAGRNNDPFHPDAMLALVELLREIGPPGLRISFP